MTVQFTRNYKILVLISITLSRAVYALNWYTLSPGLAQVSRDFALSSTSLGILESAFLAGAGIFQLPSTLASSRWGAKSLCVGGMLLIALSNILAGLTGSFTELIFLRFTLGIGASMFFAPTIALVGNLFRNERQGLALGIYNSAFSVGGSVALFGWAYIDSMFGWREGLIIGAVLAAALGIENLIVIRHSSKDPLAETKTLAQAKGVLKNKQIWLLSVGIIGLWAGYYVAGQFIPFYEETVKLVSPSTSSFLAAQLLLWPVVGSIVGGYLSDRLQNRKLFMLIPTIAFGASICFLGITNLPESFALVISLGVMDSFIFAAMYASPYQMEELNNNQKIIAISLMNSVQISGAFIGPIVFSLVEETSPVLSWVAVGIFVLVFTPALALVKEPFARKKASVA
ncbi:MAG: MFS transporter [Nitrososphaerales archaeon]